MPTIIDSLLVKFGLDSSDFNNGKDKVDKGLKNTGNEADKTGSKLKKSGKDGAEGFNTMAASAAKFFALVGGTMAIKRFIEQTIESNAALDRFSKNLQENAATVSAWSNSAELAGGSVEGLQGTLDMLSKSQTELQLTGQSQLIPYFSALGVSIADASGKARSGNDVLLDLADRFSHIDRTTANNMGRMMGIDQGTMNLLLKGRKEVELMVARQKEYGAVTKKQAEESSRLQAVMIESKQSFAAFARELLSNSMPALEWLFSVMKDLGAWMRENSEFVKAFLTIIAAGLAAIAAATIPINLTVVAVLGLAAAIAALWQDYQTWKRGGDSFIDWGKWEPGFTAAGHAIKALKILLEDMVYRAIAAADVLSAVFNRDWKRAKFAIGEFMAGNGTAVSKLTDVMEDAFSDKKTTKPQTAPAAPQPAQAGKPQAVGVPADVLAAAQASEQKYGVPAAITTAQWQLESGGGKHMPKDSNNPFGIKAKKGQPFVEAMTTEVINGKEVRMMQKFAKYESLNQAFDEHAKLLATSKYYAKARATKTPGEYADALTGVYATDQNYGSKLRKIMDAQKVPPASKPDAVAQVAPAAPKQPQGATYAERREAAGVAAPTPPAAPAPASKPDAVAVPKSEKLYSAQPGPLAALGGIPGAAQAAQGAGAAQAAAASVPAQQPATASNNIETHIGEVKVITAATDAAGIAKDMGRSLDYLFTSQANYGLS